MKKLIYGVAYYPEYEPYERIDKDFEMMKAAGINTIRVAESTWSTWEKREGEFDFSILVKTLEKAEEYGLDVIVGTPTYAVPAWLVKKDPEVLAETKNGRGLYGARQIMDITNATYRDAAEKIIRKLMEVVQPYRCVIGFQIDNETKHYGTAGPKVREKFKEYLKEKFGSVEELNAAFGFAYWSNSIADWDDLPDVRGTINGSYEAEFERFQRSLAAEFLLWQRKIVDEYRREDQFVTHNFDFEWKSDELAPFGHSYGVQPGIDHFEASNAVTIAGCDIYHPTQDDLTGAEIAYGGDSTRSLKNAPYIVLETEAQAFRYWTPFPGQLRQQALSHLASGALGVEYWHWHSIHNSFETYWKGLLSHDLERNRIYDEACEIGDSFKKLTPYMQGITKQNKAAVIVDNLSQTALANFPIGDAVDGKFGQKLTYNDVVRAYYDALYEQNIECDVVDVKALEANIKKYRMLVIPALYCVSDKTIALLRNFVEEGGVLAASFKSFFTDENVKVWSDRQPHNMTDVFGMYYQEFTRPGKTKLQGKAVDVWQELLIPDGAESIKCYEHKYWGKYAAITGNSFGKGYAVYIGCWCDKAILKEELKAAAFKAGIETVDAKFPIIIRSVRNEENRKIHFVFNYSEFDMSMICPYAECVSLTDGREFKKGSKIELKDWDALVLIENNLS